MSFAIKVTKTMSFWLQKTFCYGTPEKQSFSGELQKIL